MTVRPPSRAIAGRTPGRPRRDAMTWRVSKTMRPNDRGAVKLTRLYGEELLCVRYRTNRGADERITTVELIVDRVAVQKRSGDDLVAFKIKGNEFELQRWARSRGATYDRHTRMWRLQRRMIIEMGLQHRIAVPLEEMP
jgi:hypothetical protein